MTARSEIRLGALGGLVAAATCATVATSGGWPGRLPLHILLFVGAGGLWAGTLALLPRIARIDPRRELAILIAVWAAVRVPAWAAAPAHSDDAYRYAWDGRVTRAGVNPYRFAPAAPELAGLRGGAAIERPVWERGPSRPTASGGPLWARVNNPDLPTIYPPLAQAAFALAALLPLPPIAALKLLGALADLAAALVLFGMLKRRGDDPRRAIAWAWSPLAAIELGQDVHVDGLAIAALVGALALARLERPRWALAGLLLGAATGIKLITAPLFGAFRSARGWLAGAALLALGTLPFLGAGRAMLGSSGEFARRWRGNDGLYALVQAATDRVVCRAIGAPRVEVTWREGPRCDAAIDLWPRQRLAEAISGRTYRAAVYPDELSSFLARAATGALLAAVALWVLVRRRDPIGGCELWLGALLLATPALHPWYAAWLLPLVALTRRRAWVALAALIPLGYWPMAAWLAGGPWRDPAWTRVLEHGAAWSLLGLDAVGAIRARRAERREKQASAATPNG